MIMGKYPCFLFSLVLLGVASALPSDLSLVASYPASSSSYYNKEDTTEQSVVSHNPEIYEMDITSNISNRFAKTLVASKVKNQEKEAKETTFTVVLPDTAFISEFVMEIGGKSYKAYVKEKEEAKQIYDQAVATGRTAAHVAVSARNSNKFTVSVNIEPESKVAFLLTYEELLERKYDRYELVLNIHPGQIVKNLNVKVQINESRPLKFVRTPPLRSGNEISKSDIALDPSADIEKINSTTAVVRFHPDAEKQRGFAKELTEKESDGISGQFVVQYDVERDPHGGEVLLQDGYFVHFFAPSDLEPLPKHVLFVLDSSGSMGGRKIDQVKDAMNSILKEIREEDIISIIDFGSEVYVWDIAQQARTMITFGYGEENYEEPFDRLSKLELPQPIIAKNETLTKAKQVSDGLWASGGTNMIGGLETALYLAKLVQDRPNDKKYQPIMIFLTDGQPNVGVGSTEEITRIVTRLNKKNNNIPIFSLSFGTGADKEFLRKLSLKNLGFSRHIYEAADASLQLQEFYRQISSPLLSNITFSYNADAKDVTKMRFPIYFKGSEIVVTGKYDSGETTRLTEPITCWSVHGLKTLRPTIERPVTSLERLWAYLTVRQTLEERELADNKQNLTKKALDLALKYSFVTDVTSLVVVKPNETKPVDTEDASDNTFDEDSSYRFGSSHGLTTTFQIPAAPVPVYSKLASVSRSGGSYAIPLSGSFGNSHARPSLAFYTPVSTYPRSGLYASSIGFSAKPARPLDSPSFGGGGILYHRSPSLGGQDYHYNPPTVIPSTTPKRTLQDDLPWLVSALNQNGTITIAGNVYELGESQNVTSPKHCQNTPNQASTGECVLLKNCPQAYNSLTDFQTFQQYFCPIDNKYAGICCPTRGA